jgi:hypothetical protein
MACHLAQVEKKKGQNYLAEWRAEWHRGWDQLKNAF